MHSYFIIILPEQQFQRKKGWSRMGLEETAREEMNYCILFFHINAVASFDELFYFLIIQIGLNDELFIISFR